MQGVSTKMTPRFQPPRFEPTANYDILIKRHNRAKPEYNKTVQGHQLNRIIDTLEENFDRDFDKFGRLKIASTPKR